MHSSLTVRDSSWTLKFDNLFEFQNVISENVPPTTSAIMTHCVENRYATHPIVSLFYKDIHQITTTQASDPSEVF